MPYIKSTDGRREKLQQGGEALTAGELNYQIFYYVKHNDPIRGKKIKHFIRPFLGENPNYQKYNDMTGVLIRCYKEIERRMGTNIKEAFIDIMESYDNEINEYENTKILENGDVE